MKAKNELTPWLQSPNDEWDPRFSPDGRWIAYTSTASATKQFEVFVSPVEPFSPQPISYHGGGDRAGGRGPRWANGGNEIFYLTLTNKLMVLQVKPEGTNMKIVGKKFLFQTHAIGGAGNYDVSADGTRIIINTQDEEQISPPLWLVSNWTQLLKKKMK